MYKRIVFHNFGVFIKKAACFLCRLTGLRNCQKNDIIISIYMMDLGGRVYAEIFC